MKNPIDFQAVKNDLKQPAIAFEVIIGMGLVVFLIWLLCTAKVYNVEASDPIMPIEDYSTSLPDYPKLSFDFSAPDNPASWTLPVNMDRLAKAVAMHETKDCKLGYGKQYNNCFGIKNGNTAPCKKVGRNRMCIYDHPSQSYEAFKKIWSTWYSGRPTLAKARKWSGNDRSHAWLTNVNHLYEQNL